MRRSERVLVDANVLLDLTQNDATWQPWSAATLATWAERAVLVINALIYAEVSVGFGSIETLDAALPSDVFVRDVLPFEAGFLAGKAFLAYRRRGGERTAPMPDFYIGAHAMIRGYRLMTRDPRPYRTYFPRLELIAPVTRPTS